MKKFKNWLIAFQKNAKLKASKDPSNLVHFYHFYFVVSFIVIISTAIFFKFSQDDELSSKINIAICALVPLIWELLQKYWMGGKNTFWKMLQGWLWGFVPALPLAILLPLKFL